MPVFPEREKNVIETPEEASALTIERKEVVTPVPIHFQKQVKSDSGIQVLNFLGQPHHLTRHRS